MKIRIRKIFPALLLLAAFWLVAGALFPFIRYQKVSEDTREAFDPEDYEGNGPGPDRVMLLETNESALEHRLRLMNGAKSRIILSTFDMRAGESARDLLSVLWHKAEEGVEVKILVDGISGLIRMEPEPLFHAAASHPNIEIRLYNPVNLLTPWTSQGRMHDKYVIVDSRAFILGGRNTFDYFLGSYDTENKSLDREALVYNTAWESETDRESALYEVENYFENVWNLDVCKAFHEGQQRITDRMQEEIKGLEKRYQTLLEQQAELFEKPYDYQAHTCGTEKVRLVSGPTGIYGKEPRVFYTITELMLRAEDQVVIHTPYVVSNDDMNQRLREIAEAVPEARLVINSVENGDNFVASSDYQYHKKDVLDTGFSIYEYDGGYSTHGKSFVVDDDLCGIGSYNFDLRSTYMDTELMLVIRSKAFTERLLEAMGELERDCRLAVNETDYIVPEHLIVERAPLWKRAAWKIVGLLLQPVRCLA